MKEKRIIIGSDHAGFDLKIQVVDHLKQLGFSVYDVGTHSKESCDYVDFAEKVAEAVSKGEYERGILICGSGIGMSIVANKFKGVRAALSTSPYHARKSREDNNSNVLTMGGRVTTFEIAKEIVNVWLETEFLGGRHERRVNKIFAIEDKNFK